MAEIAKQKSSGITSNELILNGSKSFLQTKGTQKIKPTQERRKDVFTLPAELRE